MYGRGVKRRDEDGGVMRGGARSGEEKGKIKENTRRCKIVLDSARYDKAYLTDGRMFHTVQYGTIDWA
jgi:hypothetical protein